MNLLKVIKLKLAQKRSGLSTLVQIVFASENREVNHHGISVPANENKNQEKKNELFYVRYINIKNR